MPKLTTRQCVVIARYSIPEADYDAFKAAVVNHMDAIQYTFPRQLSPVRYSWDLQYLAIDQPLTDVIRKN